MNLKLLKNKNFTLLILGKFVSLIGTYMQDFALALYVLKITGSSLLFGSVITVAMIPRLILSPICGVFADRFDRKKIIVWLDMLSGILIGILYLISITVGVQLIHVYITVIALSVISSLFQPAISAAIPAIVEKDELADANSFNMAVMTLGSLISPILAGVLYGTFGLPIVLLINAVSFVCSSISEMFIDMKQQEKKEGKFSYKEFSKDFAEGLSFIRGQKQILKLMCSALIVNSVFNPIFNIGFIIIAKQVIMASDIQLGYVNSILVVGAMLGALSTGFFTRRMSLLSIFYNVLYLCSFIILLMAGNTLPAYLQIFSTTTVPFISFVALCFIIVFAIQPVNIAIQTMMQQVVPLEKMGRIGSITTTIAMAATPIGQMIYSAMFEFMPLYIPILISALVLFANAAYIAVTATKEEKQLPAKVKAVSAEA